MSPLIYIIIAIVLVAVLAYTIVNVIPKKLHWILSLLFIGLIVWLTMLIYNSIMVPIEFKKKKVVKYALVIDNLKMIKDAQIAHRKIKGGYISDPQKLINFIDSAKYAITRVRNISETVSIGGGMSVEREKRVVDTTGYKPVKDDFKGRDFKNMFKVPGTTAMFEMKTDSIEKSGLTSPVFVARVAKNIVLEGMDKQLLAEEMKALGGINVRGSHISVGSLTDVKVIGNWPPFYDNKDKEATK